MYIINISDFLKFALVAQADRATDCGSVGWGFESPQAYQSKNQGILVCHCEPAEGGRGNLVLSLREVKRRGNLKVVVSFPKK